MKQVGLNTGEVIRNAHRFAGPDQHRVLPAEVAHGSTLPETSRARDLWWAVQVVRAVFCRYRQDWRRSFLFRALPCIALESRSTLSTVQQSALKINPCRVSISFEQC